MSFLPVPTAAEVVNESRLRPEQVDRDLADEAALLTETTARITKKAQLVETKVLALVTQAEWEAAGGDTKTRRETVLTDAILLLSVASLYGSAGHLRSAFWEKAAQLKAEGMDMLQGVLDEIAADLARDDDSEDNDGFFITSLNGYN